MEDEEENEEEEEPPLEPDEEERVPLEPGREEDRVNVSDGEDDPEFVREQLNISDEDSDLQEVAARHSEDQRFIQSMGRILNHARDRRKFMQDALDADRRNGRNE